MAQVRKEAVDYYLRLLDFAAAVGAPVVSCHGAVGRVRALAFDSKRYVGAQIGVHNQKGERVGRVSHLRNLEYLLIAGEGEPVDRLVSAYGDNLVATS